MPATNAIKELAQQRINHLFELAMESAIDRPDLSTRYVGMAIQICKRIRVRIPHKWKYFICSSCLSFIYPGASSRVRVKQKRCRHIVVTCLKCGSSKRYILKTPLKEKV